MGRLVLAHKANQSVCGGPWLIMNWGPETYQTQTSGFVLLIDAVFLTCVAHVVMITNHRGTAKQELGIGFLPIVFFSLYILYTA